MLCKRIDPMKENKHVEKDSVVTTVERSGFERLSIHDLVVAHLPADYPVEVLRHSDSESRTDTK